MDTGRLLLAALAAAALAGFSSPACAGRTLGTEWWVGGGFNRTDYDDNLALIRGGGGLLLFEHVTLGANLQADRERWFGFGYAGLLFPEIGGVEPYGRFHAGRRDDLDDDAFGWTGGVRYGPNAVKLYFEVFGVIEPGYGTGFCIGIAF